MEQCDYVRRLLDAYRTTPGTCGAVRRPDRVLAAQLHQRGVPLEAVENAFVGGGETGRVPVWRLRRSQWCGYGMDFMRVG